MTLTPEERKLRAQIAAHSKWATTDPVAGTAAARAKFMKQFEDEVDPDRKLPEKERLQRAEHARKAHFARLAFLSVKARQNKGQTQT